MIVLDASVVISAVAGVYVRRILEHMLNLGADLAIPRPHLEEAEMILITKLGFDGEGVRGELVRMLSGVRLLESDEYDAREAAARARLHERGQSDWPILATALSFNAGIWSNDRDFFGVGVPVWSTRNVHLAAESEAT